MLTLHASMYSFDGPDLNHDRKAFAFRVVGMPDREEAIIAEMNYRWKILRIRDGVSDGWSGRFGSAEEALASIP
jgi:hypothetical protein